MQTPQPLSPLPDIDDVRPISDEDQECIQDVRQVLIDHGALGRFGLTLLHEHFEVGPDEIMMEFVDKEERVLTTRPIRAAGHSAENSIQTSWRLDTLDGMQYCERYCERPWGPSGPHTGGHARI